MKPIAALVLLALAGPALAQHDHSQAAAMAGLSHDMPSAFGPYSMAREGSGTAWQPDNFGVGGLMSGAAGWSIMAHGFVNAVHDDQGGPRGDSKSIAQSMFMVMG